MRISIEEVAALIAASTSRAAYDAKEIATLQERILKLEYKYKELIDILTDLRANQIMEAKDKGELPEEITICYKREE